MTPMEYLQAAFGLNLVQPGTVPKELGRLLNEVEQVRLLADYTGEEIHLERATWAVDQASNFVTAIRTTFFPDKLPK